MMVFKVKKPSGLAFEVITEDYAVYDLAWILERVGYFFTVMNAKGEFVLRGDMQCNDMEHWKGAELWQK